MKILKSYVDGRWHEPATGLVPLIDPSTEEVIAQTSSEGVDFAAVLQCARQRGGLALREMSLAERGSLLKAMSKALREKRDELLDLSRLNNGTTLSDGAFDIDGGGATLAYYAQRYLSSDAFSPLMQNIPALPKGKGLERYLSPEVSPRMRGVVEKCSFCHHRLMRAKNKAYAEGNRELEEGEYIPACAEACPARAITFGDLKNPDHQVSRLIMSPYAFRILERLGTEPKVYYLSSKDWVRKMADNYLPDEFKPVSRVKVG